MYSGSSTPVVLETSPQPGGILMKRLHLSGNTSNDRAAASTLWDKSFVVETINKCHKHLLLVGLEGCQEQAFPLPPDSVISLGSIKLFSSPLNTNLSLPSILTFSSKLPNYRPD